MTSIVMSLGFAAQCDAEGCDEEAFGCIGGTHYFCLLHEVEVAEMHVTDTEGEQP